MSNPLNKPPFSWCNTRYAVINKDKNIVLSPVCLSYLKEMGLSDDAALKAINEFGEITVKLLNAKDDSITLP